MRGYFGIGVQNLKTEINLGTLFRSAYCMGASFVFVIGRRYKKQSSDTTCSYRHIPLFQYESSEHFLKSIPYDCPLIGVELTDTSENIYSFVHPERAVYCLGAEDGSLTFLNRCVRVIQIPSKHCLNVAVAGSIVMYDRNLKSK